jgi:two-component system response regulator RstA
MEGETLGTVLLVEDDAKLASLVAEFLGQNGYAVTVEGRGDLAPARILAESPDVVILDIMLPGLDGLSVCRRVRSAYTGAILVLTARGDDVDEVVGLEVGADDYMAKPVRPRVLLARLGALLRRTRDAVASPVRVVEVGRLRLDPANRTAALGAEAIELSTAEFDLLHYLALHAGEVVERDQIYRDIRGISWDGSDRSVDLRISRLRKKLGDDEKPYRVVKSVRGTGYLLVVDP